MRKLYFITTTLLISSVVYAFGATLINKDRKGYDYKLKCAGTEHRHIGSVTTVSSLRSGCTLIIDGVGSVKLKDNMKCIINNGKLTCK